MVNPAPIVVVPKKRGWGCFGCGCAILGVIALLLLALAVFVGVRLYHGALALTSPQGVAIATVDRGPAVYDGARKKLDNFEQAFYQQQPATLHLNSDEINTLIARDPAYSSVRGHLLITLQGQSATIQGSVPLSAMENTVMADRYVNVNATLGISLDPGTHGLVFDLQQLTLNGQAMPASSDASLSQVTTQMVNQKLQENQLARDFMARTQKADIENGELVIETK